MDMLNLKEVLSKLESASECLLDKRVQPLMENSIGQLSAELKSSISEVSEKIEHNLSLLSREVHNHRSITMNTMRALIDFSANKCGVMIDQRVAVMKAEVSELIDEKTEKPKQELDEAASRIRRTMYVDAAISSAAAMVVAHWSFIYRRVTAGELDPYIVFRVALLGCATFSTVLGLLNAVERWRGMVP